MKIAFIGLGAMGGPMARKLREAGFELSVYNRTREKAERFAAEHGARVAATPADAAEGADALITIVPDPRRSRRCCSATTAGRQRCPTTRW